MNHCLTNASQLEIPSDPNHYNQYNGQYNGQYPNQMSSGQMSQQIPQQMPNTVSISKLFGLFEKFHN